MRTFRVLAGPAAVAAIALATYLVVSSTPPLDPLLAAPAVHFWLVSATSLLAFALALAVAVAGARARDGRVLQLGAGLAGLGGFFALHGLATPGFLVESGAVVGVSAQLSVISLAGWMFVAAYRTPQREGRGPLRLVAVWGVLLAAAIVLGLLRPELARFLPIDRDPLRWGVTALVLAVLGAAGARFLEGYRLSRSGLHLVMLYVVGLVGVTQVVMVSGEVFRLSWWLYHLLLATCVAAMVATIARQMRSGKLDAALRALLDDDAERRLAYGLRPEVRALVVATEAKDRYTAGHMQRVATFAVRLGSALGLDPDDLRALAQAGVIHDVGKIEVPDVVLNKTGRLTVEEYALIKQHPEVGERIAHELGLHRRELSIIRHHHERWDGSGYPDRLTGEEIPRLARVLSVVDVYDAMTSKRSYREPLRPEEANSHIERGAGSSFDPVIARAWVALARAPAEVPAQPATASATPAARSGTAPG